MPCRRRGHKQALGSLRKSGLRSSKLQTGRAVRNRTERQFLLPARCETHLCKTHNGEDPKPNTNQLNTKSLRKAASFVENRIRKPPQKKVSLQEPGQTICGKEPEPPLGSPCCLPRQKPDFYMYNGQAGLAFSPTTLQVRYFNVFTISEHRNCNLQEKRTIPLSRHHTGLLHRRKQKELLDEPHATFQRSEPTNTRRRTQ